ncbi:hypothetical protein HPB47_004705 [Ixodes persulcatus]|uniref:Uncharacterized protein n=1 Tax=Ixodes persulcatus TaxID=34615 RepID=A0AC60PEX6_IXOPE|nr:hypothetical protein HPB47_004705 [Ixodes persulcatus]
MADNSGCASTPAAKRKKQGARCSDRQLDMLIDYMFSNRVLVRAATESTLTTAERTALWDVITGRLNAEGPAWKERVEWKNLWNARVCSARKHDGLLAVEAARTGGGANPVCPLNEVETRILAIVERHRRAAVACVPGSPSRPSRPSRSLQAKRRLVDAKELQVKGLRCLVVDPSITEVRLRLHCIPYDVPDDVVRKGLEPYGKVLEVSREKWNVEGFQGIESTTRAPKCSECFRFGHDGTECVRSYARVASGAGTAETNDHAMDAEKAERTIQGLAPEASTPAKERKSEGNSSLEAARENGGSNGGQPEGAPPSGADVKPSDAGADKESNDASTDGPSDMDDTSESTKRSFDDGTAAGNGARQLHPWMERTKKGRYQPAPNDP